MFTTQYRNFIKLTQTLDRAELWVDASKIIFIKASIYKDKYGAERNCTLVAVNYDYPLEVEESIDEVLNLITKHE